MVRRRFAADAALRTFRRAARRCFSLLTHEHHALCVPRRWRR